MPFLLLAVLTTAGAESLWSPDFKGYISGSNSYAEGDALVVQIDASSLLSFSSSSNDSKNFTLEFTGGESGNLFSFLPQLRTGGSRTTEGKDNFSLKTLIPVVVTAIAPNGTAQVQGSRSISVEGKNESITVSGSISPGLLDRKGTISFSRLISARLAYTTFLSSTKDVLTQADLKQLLAPATAPGAQPAGTPAQPAAGAPAAAPVPPAAGTLTITDARKKELLLLYLNRLIDIVFPQ